MANNVYLPPDPAAWSILDVLQWLQLIEATRHSERFRTEAITGPILMTLDENGLLDLGVKDPIERRRIFLEIQLLKTSAAAASSEPSGPEAVTRGSLLKMRRAQKNRRSRDLSRSSSLLKVKGLPRGSSKKIEAMANDSDEKSMSLSDQLMVDERQKLQTLIANLVIAMDTLRSMRKKDDDSDSSSSSSDSDSDDENWPEGPTPKLYRRQRRLNLAGLERKESQQQEDDDNDDKTKAKTMFSGILNDEEKKKSKKVRRDRWYEVMGPPQKPSAREIAEQYRMDVSFKKLRRGSRIILRPQAQTSMDDEPEVDDDLGDDEQPVAISKWVILPTNSYRLGWDFIIMLLVIYYGLITPVNMAFDDAISYFPMDTAFNCLFIIDICLNFFTAFRIEKGPRKGQLEVQLPQIRKAYLKQWFWIDLMASVPLDMIFGLVGIGISASFNKLVRLIRGFKLVRVMKMSRVVKRLSQGRRANPGVMRLLKNLLFLVITWHWMGCTYWILADFIGFDDQGWTPSPRMQDADVSLKYLQAFYWSLAATTSVGKNLEPNDDLTTWFTLAMVVVGVMIMALVIGASSLALEDMDAADNERRNRLEAINVFFAQKHDMDGRLKKKIMSYYDYMLTRSAGMHLLEDLHTTLKSELTWDLYEKMTLKVPIFDGLSQDCIAAIMRDLAPKTFLPKEYICLEGERLSMLYFILSGRVAVVDESNKKQKHLKILKNGGFFGELCVISNTRMANTIQALSYCDILLLHKQQVKRILRYHPEFLVAIQKYIRGQVKASGWEKITFIVNNLRMLHLVGADITFQALYPKFTFMTIMSKSRLRLENMSGFSASEINVEI